MKINNTLLITILSLLTFTAQAQKLSISKTVVDVGKTGYEVPVTAVFELRNRGMKTLHISKVQTDCGCTQVDYPKKGVSPGDNFTIALTYDARQLGHFQKQVAVYSNATRKPLYLKMKGVVMTEVKDYSKTYPYHFGSLLTDVNDLEFDDVNKGDQPQLTIKMVNDGETMMTPNLMHLPSYLSAKCEPEKLGPGQTGKITVTLHSERINGYGLTQAPVFLACQLGEKVRSEIEIPVSVVLLPDTKALGLPVTQAPQIQLSAEQLNMGIVDGKKVKTGVINIANSGRSELNIRSMQLFTGGMKVTLGKRNLQPGETTRLKVTADRNQLLRQRTKPRVLMITNDPKRPKVIITVNIK